jgi:hypothetical protein
MLSDPQSVTVNAVAQSLPRVEVGTRTSTYEKNDGTFRLEVSHQTTNKGRTRHVVRFIEKAVVTNPLDSTNDFDSYAITIIDDRPGFGFSMTRAEQLHAAIFAWYNTAMVDKIFGQES